MTTLFWKKKFPEKSEVFFLLEVKIVGAKKKAIVFGPVFGVAFFGKRFEEKSRRSKIKATMNIDPPQQQIFTREASAIFQHEISTTRRISTATSRNDNGRGGKTKLHYGTLKV